MANLDSFLSVNIEQYLFGDIDALKTVPVGYPMLMTCFAGIELFGALLSENKFATGSGHGADYFKSYWSQRLYPLRENSADLGSTLYQLARHGIAHGFAPKGPIAVGCVGGGRHLTREDGVWLVDPHQLADDLKKSYAESLKKVVASETGTISRNTIQARLNEMEACYSRQVAAHPFPEPVTPAVPTGTRAVSGPWMPATDPTQSSTHRTIHGATGPTFPG